MRADGDDGLAVAAARAQALVEGAQRAGLPDHRPGRLDQRPAGRGRAALGDPAAAGELCAGLAHARIKPEIGDQRPRAAEPADIADRGQKLCRADHVHAGHGQQPARLRRAQRLARDQPLGRGDLAVEELDVAQRALERLGLLDRQLELAQPLASLDSEEVRHRRLALQAAHQHRMDLVLGARPAGQSSPAPGGCPCRRGSRRPPAARAPRGSWRSPTRRRSPPAPLDLRARGLPRTAPAPPARPRSGPPSAPPPPRRWRPHRNRGARPTRSLSRPTRSRPPPRLDARENQRANDNDRYVLKAQPGQIAGAANNDKPALKAHRPNRPARPRSPESPRPGSPDRKVRTGQQPSEHHFHAPTCNGAARRSSRARIPREGGVRGADAAVVRRRHSG